MYTQGALLDVMGRSQASLIGLLGHCRGLNAADLGRELDGFGYPSVQLQIHHAIGAQRYWVGVLEGRMDVDENESDWADVDALDQFRRVVLEVTDGYLRSKSDAELNQAGSYLTWGDREVDLVPARVLMRTFVHFYSHQGQVAAMCRLLGNPIPAGLDFPLTT